MWYGSVFNIVVLPTFHNPAAKGAVLNAIRHTHRTTALLPFTMCCVAVTIFGDAISGPS
jgi:hypothetical protein